VRPFLGPVLPGVHWTGPALVFLTLVLPWPAFRGATGEDGDVSVAFFVGACAISAMAWGFVLASRLRVVEILFGGQDRAYRAHRWISSVAVTGMYLHVQWADDMDGGFAGAARRTAKSAEDLAGLAEKLVYVLMAVSIVRLVPYRWWRQTHRFFIIPYVFASWHFYTARKPFPNDAGWGRWFVVVMAMGVAAWVWRVLVSVNLRRGHLHTVASVTVSAGSTRLGLVPARRRVRFAPGQFAFLRPGVHGMGEPHPFSIASAPGDETLVFHIRDLGDWTHRIRTELHVGDTIRVEGPYGRFAPLPSRPSPTVWVAGGAGITPFLSAIAAIRGDGRTRPHLFYAFRDEETAVALDELREAHRVGVIVLHEHESSRGNRFDDTTLRTAFPDGLRKAHVAACGPKPLTDCVVRSAWNLGVRRVEREAFDFRSGVGPDISRELDAVLPKPLGSRSR
jgi:predicted ferric reductase